jgi:glycosyltransferase involved in cell wall biosynthesis
VNHTFAAGSRALTLVVSASTLPAHAEDRVPRFVLDQASAFAEQGATVHLLAPHAPASHSRRWPQQEAPRVTQWRFRYAPRRLEVLTDHGIMPSLRERPWLVLLVPALIAAQFLALWRLVRRVRPDVIYAHWFTPQALTACVVAALTLTPFGFTTHASDVAVWRRFGGLGRRLVRVITARAAFITAVSTQTAAKLRSFLDAHGQMRLDERLKIIPMGIDLAHPVPTHRNPRLAVIVARFVEKKGIDVLLDAWPAVVAALPDASLIIAGAGPEEERYRAIIRERDLKIDMPGYVAGEAKARLLASAGVVIQPSVIASDGDSDGLPVALLEGIAAGCIPVASDASGAQDIIEAGKHGFLTPSGDAPALARAIIGAMTLPEEDRQSTLDAGQRLMTRLTWPQVAREHLVLLAAAAGRCRGGSTPAC